MSRDRAVRQESIMNLTLESIARFSAVLVVLGALAMLIACASGGKGEPPPVMTSFNSAEAGIKALAGDWKIIELRESDISLLLPSGYAGRDPMLTIMPDGSVSGFSGANQFGSTLLAQDLTRSRFALGAIAMTRMAGPSELMSIEAKLTQVLAEPRRFSLRENILTLMPAEGRADPMVKFRRLPGPPTGKR